MNIVLLRTIFMDIGAYTSQNIFVLCNFVRFGVHFLRTFSLENIYDNLNNDLGG